MKKKIRKYVRDNDFGYRYVDRELFQMSVVGTPSSFYIFAPETAKELSNPSWSKTMNNPELHHELHVALEDYDKFSALVNKTMKEQPQKWVRV